LRRWAGCGIFRARFRVSRRSSVVEHVLGKDGVGVSITLDGTTRFPPFSQITQGRVTVPWRGRAREPCPPRSARRQAPAVDLMALHPSRLPKFRSTARPSSTSSGLNTNRLIVFDVLSSGPFGAVRPASTPSRHIFPPTSLPLFPIFVCADRRSVGCA
jgi:hypothetical protein